MKILKEYFALQKQIFDYFGYVEDWKVIPLDDQTDQYWILKENEHGGSYAYCKNKFTKEIIEDGGFYGGKIYTQRFLPKHVYRAKDYTMICADTECDGNKFLMIFDNSKEEKNIDLKLLYEECW